MDQEALVTKPCRAFHHTKSALNTKMATLLSGLLDYLIGPVLVAWVAAHAAFWWTEFFTKVPENHLPSGIFFLLFSFAVAYESGYKKYYLYGSKKYFFIVHISALVVAICGFFYGLWIVYL